MLDISRVLKDLAEHRPVFHSEADFQHEFAVALRMHVPEAHLRLEVPFAFESRGSTDIVVRLPNTVCGIELKYFTKRLAFRQGNEMFELKAHGATDLRRYDVIKDVQRLERFNREFGGPSYIIALTNDPAYWTPINRSSTIDAAFRLCEGSTITGTLAWAPHASPGSIRNREKQLELSGIYQLAWGRYSDLEVRGGEFRFLLLTVG